MPIVVVDTPLTITVLKHLINGRDLAFAATVTGLSAERVRQIAQSHGYPDISKLTWAVDVLSRQLNEIPAGTAPSAALRPVSRPAPPVAAPHQQVPDRLGWESLVAKGKDSTKLRTRQLAEKIEGLIGTLLAKEQADEQAAKAERERDMQREYAKEQITKLEEKLRQAKAMLKGGPAAPQLVKEATHHCDCGHAPFTSSQGLALHRRRAHGDLQGNPNAHTEPAAS
jgi:hypothetical protein